MRKPAPPALDATPNDVLLERRSSLRWLAGLCSAPLAGELHSNEREGARSEMMPKQSPGSGSPSASPGGPGSRHSLNSPNSSTSPSSQSSDTDDGTISPAHRLRFPRDFGAHPSARTEWWYVTGWLDVRTEARTEAGTEARSEARSEPGAPGGMPRTPTHGFQITFFRSRTEVDTQHPSRFAARQLIFAHVALTDLTKRQLHHDQRIARAGFGVAEARTTDTDVTLRDWHLGRAGPATQSRYRARIASEMGGFRFDFELGTTQPVLLQGDQGYSRKGRQPGRASHYYSQPQLSLTGTLAHGGPAQAVRGVAWLDHEWSNALLDDQSVGWDWIGMNLDDGSTLTAFQLRSASGAPQYAGGSFRGPGALAQSFGPEQVQFSPGRRWFSPGSKASYPVEWVVSTPAGRFTVRSLLDNQELDSRGSTGLVYWEGLSELLDDQGKRVGRGYLEMTGYAGRVVL